MTRARIMRVNSRQKRVNQIRASFVKDARRQMRVDTRSLAGAHKSHHSIYVQVVVEGRCVLKKWVKK